MNDSELDLQIKTIEQGAELQDKIDKLVSVLEKAKDQPMKRWTKPDHLGNSTEEIFYPFREALAEFKGE